MSIDTQKGHVVATSARGRLLLDGTIWKERGWPAGDHMMACAALMRCQALLAEKFATALSDFGLSYMQYAVLVNLELHGAERLGRIAKYLLVSPSRLTYVIDQLEASKLLRRTGSGADKRVVRAAITPAGSERLRQINLGLGEARFFLGSLSDEDANHLLEHLGQVQTSLGDR